MINDKEFSLAKPHCVSHARFMQRGINYITLQLHGHQADYMNYTESEQQEVELMAEYTALYYAPRFLQSSLPAEAPIMDLRNIWDIRAPRDMAREELNKDPDNRATRLRQEAAQNLRGHKVYALATGAGSPRYTLVPRAGSPRYTSVIGLAALGTHL